MSNGKTFRSILDLIQAFPDEKTCSSHLAEMRWAGNPECPYCQHQKVYEFSNGIKYKCAGCRRNFSARVGSIFEDSKICLQKWFVAIYLETSHKKGISSHQLRKDIGVTQKTAWFMLHRIRESLKNRSLSKLTGVIQADEMVIGGLEKNKHADKRTLGTQGRSTLKKTAIVGVLRQGGEVRVQPVSDTTSAEIHPFVLDNVTAQSILFTDTWKGYNGLKDTYRHMKINHSSGEYVRGMVHTNGIENFWSLLSRGIIGIYHHVSPKHLARYCDEFVFRFNTRKSNEAERFNLMLLNSNGRVLPYKSLVK